MININGKPDNSYRYKMEPIKSTICGKGNGIFTIIDNLHIISKQINQPANILLKFLSIYNGSIANEEKMSITGSYTSDKLQNDIQVYINFFVICSKCGVPEIIPQLKKESKKNITLEFKCSACGIISSVICNNKSQSKICDMIIKYLDKNSWSTSKGTMIISDNKIKEENILSCEENNENKDDINPFDE